MTCYHNVLEMIGNTPLLKLTQFDTGPCELFIKLESQNPGGSIKDRIALAMISALEDSGELKPGGTIIEATAGNTGLGLALVAAAKGYPLIIVMPDKMSQEKIAHLRAMGAKVVVTRSDVNKGHPEYYQDLAESMSKDIDNCVYINQFANPINPIAHEQSTGPEIWEQMDNNIDAIVCGVGTGGTLTGIGRFMKKVSPKTEMVIADPQGSIIAELVNHNRKIEPGSWFVEGIGEDFVPSICDISLASEGITVTDQEAFQMVNDLVAKAGILAGSSSGTLLTAAIKYCQKQTSPKRVVTFICDTGNKYLSKAYNPLWLQAQNLMAKPNYGDLRDYIARPYQDGLCITAQIQEPLKNSLNRMKQHQISQLPILDSEKYLGLMTEKSILENYNKNPMPYLDKNIKPLSKNADFSELLSTIAEQHVAVIIDDTDNNKLLGLVTRIDLINQLQD